MISLILNWKKQNLQLWSQHKFAYSSHIFSHLAALHTAHWSADNINIETIQIIWTTKKYYIS